MSLEFIPNIKSLHIEPSSYCNAKCLGCSRTSDMNSTIEAPLAPAHLDLQNLMRTFKSPSLAHLNYLYLCGVIGDPMAHPEIEDFVRESHSFIKNLKIVIHTNGSLGKVDIWKKLGKISKKENLKVYFSIDGLEDTNHLYRHQVPWNPIIENANAYIEAGGKAIWKFIRFPSNEHQIKKAEKLANDMGFLRFETRDPYDSERVPTKESLEQALNRKPHAKPFIDTDVSVLSERVASLFKEVKKISCQSQRDSQLYIDAYGKVWPCCWVGNLGLPRRSFFEREYFWKTTLANYPTNFNSLNHYSFEEILESVWYKKELVESWSNDPKSKNPCLSACNKHCGVS